MRENVDFARIENAKLNKIKADVFRKTLGGAFTLPDTIPSIVVLDPTAARSVTMPDKLLVSHFTLINSADAAEVITLLDDDVSSITAGALTQAEVAFCFSDGIKWFVVVGVA